MVKRMKLPSTSLIAVLVIGVFILSRDSRPLSVKNQNPLNIRFNPANNWVGQSGERSGFVVFDAPQWGFRAATVLFRNYGRIHKLFTIEQIINRFAPPSENPTQNYVEFVANELGKSASDIVSESDYPAMMIAMSVFEGGRGHWTIEQAREGVRLA